MGAGADLDEPAPEGAASAIEGAAGKPAWCAASTTSRGLTGSPAAERKSRSQSAQSRRWVGGTDLRRNEVAHGAGAPFEGMVRFLAFRTSGNL